MQDVRQLPSVDAAFPSDVRSFEAWPTPEEIETMDIRLGVYGWVQQETGCLPGTDEWAAHIRQDPIGAFQTLMLALVNQYEIVFGLPLRWGPEWVRVIRPAEVPRYTEACQRAMGVVPEQPTTTATTGTADATGDNGRPTVAPRRRKPPATRPGTPTSSATGSPANTDGRPA